MSMSLRGLCCALLWLALAGEARAQGDTQKPPDKFIDLDLPLKEGDVKVTGRSNFARVMVRVSSGWTSSTRRAEPPAQGGQRRAIWEALEEARKTDDTDRAEVLQCLLDDPVSTAGPFALEKNAFEVLLKQRLNAGDCVVVHDADTPDVLKAKSQHAVVKSVVLDIGRLRGYFSIGGAVSRYRSGFSQTDTFIGLTHDALIAGMLIEKFTCTATDEQLKADPRACDKALYRRPAEGALALRTFRYQLNALVDASVGFKLANTGANTTQSTATGGQPAQPAFQRPDQLVFGSNQPGFFEVGLHAPLSWSGMDWRNDGKLYSFYVGPVYKWGVQSFDIPVVLRRTVAIDLAKPTTDNARYSTASETLRGGALPFSSAGIRMGVYQYELLGRERRQRQIANDPVAYLDIAWGKATAFRTYTFERTTNAAGTVETVTIDSSVRRRLALEGRLKIPYLPALVGVDVNVRGATNDDEPNEFRFIVAFRIDAQKALGRIFPNDALRADK